MKDTFDVLVVGSGAAGFACACRLYGYGVKDVCVVTQDVNGGTSRNAGSDKQTYYKLDLCAPDGDSVEKMARDLFDGGSVSGQKALIMASESVRCFMDLVEAGVPFPSDEYGRFIGYRTDHDDSARATSAGPLTSKYMTEALEARASRLGVTILDGHLVCSLAVDGGRCHGVVCLADGGIKQLYSKAVVLACGAPTGIYADSVYPDERNGAAGLALAAGAELCNFQEWQYGIASTKFRWNLSGSYQQVIPRYFSRLPDGTEREFLLDSLRPGELYPLIFAKGCHWPFDCRERLASSKIDLLVADEKRKGARVFIDYTAEPEGMRTDIIGDEARAFWAEAGLGVGSPYERLARLNPRAVELYRSHGIDPAKEPIEIGVCAQHNNGGIKTDADCETAVKGLFAIGEAAGDFGVYRPGGAALNDTQVGALRAAKRISACLADAPAPARIVPDVRLPRISDEPTLYGIRDSLARRMSSYAGMDRDVKQLESLVADLVELLDGFYDKVTVGGADAFADLLRFHQTALSGLALCRTELASARDIGSRGGCVCYDGEVFLPEDEKYRAYLTVTSRDGVRYEPVDPIPESRPMFETLLAAAGEVG